MFCFPDYRQKLLISSLNWYILHILGNEEVNQLRVWVAQNIKQADMVQLYNAKFGKTIW